MTGSSSSAAAETATGKAAPGAKKVEPPPAGPPWDLPIDETPFAFVDLEMTGLDLAKSRVIEVCVVRRRGRVIEDSFETLIRPGEAAAWQTDVHGLDPAQLEGAPTFETIAPRVEAMLDGAVLVAHAAAWDTGFLDAEFARLGKDVRFPHYVDTLVLARRAFRADGYSLEALANKFGIADRVKHRAADDVRILIELFDRIIPALVPHSARDLWHVRIAERHARPEILAVCVELAATGEPGWVTYRPSHKPPRSFQAIIREVRTDLDPPRVLGYSLPGRGRFDLRTDRILSIAKSPPADLPTP
jgi:DNA polymerase-3 subunit epsilon